MHGPAEKKSIHSLVIKHILKMVLERGNILV